MNTTGYVNHRAASGGIIDKGYSIQLPTTGWTETLVGNGTTTENNCYVRLFTGTGTSNSAKRSGGAGLLNNAYNWSLINFDAPIEITFRVARGTSDAAVTGYVWLSEDVSSPLSSKGIGLRISNLDLYGLVYDSSLHAIDLSTAIGLIYGTEIKIVLKPGKGTEFWVNGVLKVDSGFYPTGQSSTTGQITMLIENDSSVGDSAYMVVSPITIWTPSTGA